MPRSNSAAGMGMLCSWLRSICVYLRCLLMELIQGGGDRTGQLSPGCLGRSLSVPLGLPLPFGWENGAGAPPGKRS